MKGADDMQNAIRPGTLWLDTEGKRIQAHGGSIITVKDTFYWYGENKEFTTGENSLWHYGVRCYSSKNLYDWKDEGIIIPPNLNDESSTLHPTSMMDRPHIIFNQETGKYVAWLKIMGEPPCFTVLTADDILGPYTIIKERLYPMNLSVGDFDLCVDQITQKGYLISQKPHTTIYVAELNETYTDLTENFSEHFFHEAPPYAREAPAHFFRNNKHYLITSGTTGYFPNPSEASLSDGWHGPYEMLHNPHPFDTSYTSYNSQISSVFQHPYKEDLYIALADRWKPELEETMKAEWKSGEASRKIQEKFKRIFDPNSDFVFTEEDAKDMRINSSVSDYVWLPIKFKGSKVCIEWLDEWRIEDYD